MIGERDRRLVRERQHPPSVQLAIGLLIAAVGVLFTLDNLHILRARDYLRYWPVAPIAIGIAQIVQARTSARVWSGALWVVVGSALLANRLGWLHVNIWAFWPLLLVLVGGRIFWQAFHAPSTQGPLGDGDAAISALAILSGVDRRVVSPAFQRAEITAFMGGGKLDFRDASLAPTGGVVDVFTVMGGFEIIVPPTWVVDVEVTPFMGGCDNKTIPPPNTDGPHLVIRGFVMMGGLDIKNR